MKFCNKFFLSIAAYLILAFTSQAQYIQVDDNYSAQQLIENVLINSPCANVSNFAASGDPFSPGEQSYGYFNAGSSGFSFAEGIVLSTSRAKRTQGPNDNLIDEGMTNWLGDSDLEQALSITNTFNATVLEFDFIPLTTHISFDYIFSSEEYQGTAPCTYSDGFAFLLRKADGSTPYQNLALIPNTTIPVQVTSVHPDIPGSCGPQNETYFGGYNGNNHPTNFNGQTVPLTASANVIPGTAYHIKLVIADHENIRYDSAIFLLGGSFNVGTDLGPDRLIATSNPVCTGSSHLLDATEAGSNDYKWYKDNIVVIGANGPTFNVTEPGIYKVEITLGTSTCIATGEVTVEYSNLPNLFNTTLVQCDQNDDGIALFNLTQANAIITNGDPDLSGVTYYETIADANNQIDSITDPINYSTGAATVFASVSNSNGCFSVAQVQLQISNNTINNFPLLETCDLDPDPIQDGFYPLTLSNADAQVTSGLPAGLVVQYYESIVDAMLHPENVLPNIYINTVQNDQTVYAKILNGPDCYGIIPVNLVVNTLAPPDFEEEILYACPGNTLTLSVNPIYESYTWSNGDSDYTTDVTSGGTYTITVTENGCSATKTFIVINPNAPEITFINIEELTPSENTILVTYIGTGDYEFSIDGINYQASPYFTGVDAGDYIVTIRDKNGCGSDYESITILSFPKYFTPNGDGFNDYWTIGSLKSQPTSKINIFDRYGNLMYQYTGNGMGWDGKVKSKNLISNDYWFTAILENGKIIKGHFTLKR